MAASFPKENNLQWWRVFCFPCNAVAQVAVYLRQCLLVTCRYPCQQPLLGHYRYPQLGHWAWLGAALGDFFFGVLLVFVCCWFGVYFYVFWMCVCLCWSFSSVQNMLLYCNIRFLIHFKDLLYCIEIDVKTLNEVLHFVWFCSNYFDISVLFKSISSECCNFMLFTC